MSGSGSLVFCRLCLSHLQHEDKAIRYLTAPAEMRQFLEAGSFTQEAVEDLVKSAVPTKNRAKLIAFFMRVTSDFQGKENDFWGAVERRYLRDLPHERLMSMWRSADKDGSGSIDFDEFVAFYMKYFGDTFETEFDPVTDYYRSMRRVQ
ncbi:CML13 [Symbiodinium sp. CCMP2592]|nr:CML13 [Symbiodinium sp. CCMP2592]